MRVALDTFWWVSGPPSGRMIVRELVGAWRSTFPDDDLILWCPRSDASRVRIDAPGCEVIELRTPLHALANMLEVPLLLKKWRPQAVLAQNFTPLAGDVVTLMLDALYQSNPEWFTRPELAYLALAPSSARRARRVLTISETEALRIRKHNPKLRNVQSVGLAVPTSLLRAEPMAPPALNESQAFWLSVGRLNVRKNLGRTLEAAARSPIVSPQFPLLVVGEADGRSEGLTAMAQSAIADGSIRFLGSVTDNELGWLYIHAAGLIYMSLDEGFGLPPAEAMHFNCPVLVSDRPIFHEVLGKYPIYAEPTEVSSIVCGIDKLYRAGGSSETAGFMGNWHHVVTEIRSALTSVLSD